MRPMIATEQLIPNAASKVAVRNFGNCREWAVVVSAVGTIGDEPK